MNALTPGEKAYLESGGQDASALLAENPEISPAATNDAVRESAANGAAQKPDAQAPAAAAAAAAAVSSAAETPAADPTELGEEEIATPDGKTKRRVVDSRALKAEREQRRRIEAELQAERDLRARVDERLKLLTAAVEAPDPAAAAPAEDDAPIDPEQDIFGAYRQLAKKLEKLEAGHGEVVAQTQEERQTAALVTNYRRDAATFRAQKADFNDAYNFLLGKREQQLKALGYTDRDVATTLYNEEMNLASRAMSMGQSPSAQLYALAQSMGYQQSAAAPAAAPASVVSAAAPAAPAVASVTAEIDRIKAGQQSSRSLSSGGGAAGEELSLEALADMPQKQFEAFINVPGNRERVEQALGRRAA